MSILKKIYIFLSDIIVTIILAGAIFIFIWVLIVRPFQVNGQSMYPTYRTGEYVLTNLISLKFQEIQRGEVIIFHSPQKKERDFIKRVIGVPNDKVMIKNGIVYVNDKKLPEQNYLPSDYKTLGGSFLEEGKKISIPSDMYFVMGDNRGASSDSREWGFVKKEEIIGKALIVYWPIDRIRIVKNVEY